MRRFFFVMMLAGFVTVMGCEQKSADPAQQKITADDVRRGAGQAAETTAEAYRKTKEEFQKKYETQLKELDVKLAKLREKGRDLKAGARANWERKMADLEPKREAARAKLAEVGHSSAEAWKDVQKGAQAAWDELDKAFHEVTREF